jgi:DNA-binding NarL/FixJ family response regulator
MPAKPRILIAEDEAIVALQLKIRLNQKGFEVCGLVSTGEKAIEYAGKEKPDIILMDVRLSGKLDGFEAVEKIRTFSKAPVVFMTGYPDEIVRDQLRKLIPAAYLIKPVQEEKLLQAIQQQLSEVYKQD